MTGAFHNKPFRIEIQRSSNKRFRSYYRQRPGEQFMPDNFYPVGWSRDGKFAYYLDP